MPIGFISYVYSRQLAIKFGRKTSTLTKFVPLFKPISWAYFTIDISEKFARLVFLSHQLKAAEIVHIIS
jgi:hypothetical protein